MAALVEEFEYSRENEIQFYDERELSISSFRKWRYRISAKTAKPERVGQRSGFAPVPVCESGDSTQARVNIDLDSEVKIHFTSLSIKSIAQLALGVRHGR